jgi:hypothetical protein
MNILVIWTTKQLPVIRDLMCRSRRCAMSNGFEHWLPLVYPCGPSQSLLCVPPICEGLDFLLLAWLSRLPFNLSMSFFALVRFLDRTKGRNQVVATCARCVTNVEGHNYAGCASNMDRVVHTYYGVHGQQTQATKHGNACSGPCLKCVMCFVGVEF